MLYYSKNQQFVKSLIFTEWRKNHTKITYIDVTTGLVSILGWYEKHIRNLYVKRQIIAFKIQILKAELELISKKNKQKIEAKITKLLDYAQKSF